MSFSCNITQATSASTDGELTGWDETDFVLSDSGAAALPNSVPHKTERRYCMSCKSIHS